MLTAKKYEMSDIEKRLFDKLESIQKSCGQVCDTRISGKPGKVRLKRATDIFNIRKFNLLCVVNATKSSFNKNLTNLL